MAYETRYYVPSAFSRSGSALYYSYKVAGIHVIMLGCYTGGQCCSIRHYVACHSSRHHPSPPVELASLVAEWRARMSQFQLQRLGSPPAVCPDKQLASQAAVPTLIA